MTAALSASGSNFNVFYRYPRPGVSTEYFILENRQKSGRDSGIPAAGIAIWHIDERGDKDNQNLTNNTIHANYEVTLVQADNQWHFERYVNSGDASDLYYLGNSSGQYNNQFTDQTSPNAHWWDGTNSGAHFGNFSASANTMTFTVGEGEVYVALEAEVAALTAPMAKYSDPLASRGQYISSLQAGAGSGAMVFNIPVTNRYVIWARVLAADASQNSSFVSVDNVEDEFDAAEETLTNAWQWVRVNGRGGTGVPLTLNPRYFDLRAGAHSFVFRCDEAEAKLDRIIVTSDLTFTPDDTPPTITAQPRSLTVLAGADAAFKVQASGLPALSYRWLSNGVPLSTGTNADYTIGRAQTNYTAGYAVVVSNLFGAVTSQVAVLTVLEAPSGWVAFNDHFAGSGTHPNSSAWNVFGTEGGAPGNSGQLKDIITGAMLPVTLTITNANATGGTSSGAPSPGTPAYESFNRFVDFGSGTLNHA
ncbi:MAG TPA: immunoglobulin domain-containing protein, partial [Candidatus Sulfotelmatobacter sp.]|nr:immunoglobulin domain-containing protein [Candidatus Sulfotelmatobacter sp.]